MIYYNIYFKTAYCCIVLQHSDDAVSELIIVYISSFDNLLYAEKGCQFLTSSEEQSLCQYYMKHLIEFCKQFRPPVPRNVLV